MSETTQTKSLVAIAALTVIMAGVFSYFAYSPPDALEHSLETNRVDVKAPAESAAAEADTETAAAPSSTEGEAGYSAPIPDYSMPGVSSPFVSGGAAGVAGVFITFGVVAVIAVLLKSAGRRRTKAGTDG